MGTELKLLWGRFALRPIVSIAALSLVLLRTIARNACFTKFMAFLITITSYLMVQQAHQPAHHYRVRPHTP